MRLFEKCLTDINELDSLRLSYGDDDYARERLGKVKCAGHIFDPEKIEGFFVQGNDGKVGLSFVQKIDDDPSKRIVFSLEHAPYVVEDVSSIRQKMLKCDYDIMQKYAGTQHDLDMPQVTDGKEIVFAEEEKKRIENVLTDVKNYGKILNYEESKKSPFLTSVLNDIEMNQNSEFVNKRQMGFAQLDGGKTIALWIYDKENDKSEFYPLRKNEIGNNSVSVDWKNKIDEKKVKNIEAETELISISLVKGLADIKININDINSKTLKEEVDEIIDLDSNVAITKESDLQNNLLLHPLGNIGLIDQMIDRLYIKSKDVLCRSNYNELVMAMVNAGFPLGVAEMMLGEQYFKGTPLENTEGKITNPRNVDSCKKYFKVPSESFKKVRSIDKKKLDEKKKKGLADDTVQMLTEREILEIDKEYDKVANKSKEKEDFNSTASEIERAKNVMSDLVKHRKLINMEYSELKSESFKNKENKVAKKKSLPLQDSEEVDSVVKNIINDSHISSASKVISNNQGSVDIKIDSDAYEVGELIRLNALINKAFNSNMLPKGAKWDVIVPNAPLKIVGRKEPIKYPNLIIRVNKDEAYYLSRQGLFSPDTKWRKIDGQSFRRLLERPNRSNNEEASKDEIRANRGTCEGKAGTGFIRLDGKESFEFFKSKVSGAIAGAKTEIVKIMNDPNDNRSSQARLAYDDWLQCEERYNNARQDKFLDVLREGINDSERVNYIDGQVKLRLAILQSMMPLKETRQRINLLGGSKKIDKSCAFAVPTHKPEMSACHS